MKLYLGIITGLVLMEAVLGQICEPSWLLHKEKCFRYFEENVAHSKAKERCESEGARLLSNFGDPVKYFLQMHNRPSIDSSYWCNIRPDRTSAKSESFTNTTTGQPKLLNGLTAATASTKSSNEMQCCYIQNMVVYNGACDQRKGFICEKNSTSIPIPGECPRGTEKIENSCLWHHYQLLDRNAAEKACVVEGGRLAVLDSKDKEIYGIVAVYEMRESFWVGAIKRNGTTKWENGVISFLEDNGHPNIFVPFPLRNGNGIRLNDSDILHDVAWIPVKRNVLAYVLCEVQPLLTSVTVKSQNTSCPESSILRNGVCYWESTDSYDWDNARKYCEHSAGDLVSFKNASEEDIFIANSSVTQEKFWIGLRRYYGSEEFRWSDRSNLTYTNWATGQPAKNDSEKLCVVRDGQSSKWEVADCTSKLRFMCKAAEGICGGNLASDTGDFHSPNYPKVYGPQEKCMWKITVPDGYVVNLQFKFFELEESAGCGSDYVKVFDGHESTNKSLGTYCGIRNPGSITSSKNMMSILFVSDGTISLKGFSATFAKELLGKEGCGNLSSVACKSQLKIKPETSLRPPTADILSFCPEEWKMYGNMCYRFFGYQESEQKSWTGAIEECKKYGSTLVSIHSKEEQDFVMKNVSNDLTQIWIGMNSSEHWIDHSDVNFASWAINQPDFSGKEPKCVYMSESGQWYTMGCKNFSPYVCEATKVTSSTSPLDLTTVPGTSSVSSRDSSTPSSITSVSQRDSTTTQGVTSISQKDSTTTQGATDVSSEDSTTTPDKTSGSHQVPTTSSNATAPYLSNTTTPIPKHLELKQTTLHLSLGIPLAVAVLLVLFVIGLLRRKKPYTRLKEPHAENSMETISGNGDDTNETSQFEYRELIENPFSVSDEYKQETD